MTLEMARPTHEVSQVPYQSNPELLGLIQKLGIPEQYVPEHSRALLIALGPDNQPARAIDFLQFKLQQRSIGIDNTSSK